MYTRAIESNKFAIGGDRDVIQIGAWDFSDPPRMSHEEALLLAGWLAGTVLLQGQRSEGELLAELMKIIREAAGIQRSKPSVEP